MGWFDLFRKGPPKEAGTSAPVDRKVAGHAKVVADKRAQGYDREESIRALSSLRTADAAIALLRRFGFSTDPSISDQEEKELAFEGIVAAGTLEGLPAEAGARDSAMKDLEARRERIIEAVQAFCEKAEQLTWPIRVLRALLADAEYEGELLALLAAYDTDYTRNVEPKLNVIQALEDLRSEQIREAVEPFLEDANETVRFHAAETTLRQDFETSAAGLARLIAREESVRVKNKVAEGLKGKAWPVPTELRADVMRALTDTDGYSLDGGGRVVGGGRAARGRGVFG